MYPRRRTSNITVCDMAEECLVYDHERGKAHCLNAVASLVWRLCDGKTSPEEMARRVRAELGSEQAEAVVGLALEQLAGRHLIGGQVPTVGEPQRRGRRAALRQMAAILLPAIASLAAPRAAAAASPVASGMTQLVCTNDSQCAALNRNMGCMVGRCVNGQCVAMNAPNGTI